MADPYTMDAEEVTGRISFPLDDGEFVGKFTARIKARMEGSFESGPVKFVIEHFSDASLQGIIRVCAPIAQVEEPGPETKSENDCEHLEKGNHTRSSASPLSPVPELHPSGFSFSTASPYLLEAGTHELPSSALVFNEQMFRYQYDALRARRNLLKIEKAIDAEQEALDKQFADLEAQVRWKRAEFYYQKERYAFPVAEELEKEINNNMEQMEKIRLQVKSLERAADDAEDKYGKLQGCVNLLLDEVLSNAGYFVSAEYPGREASTETHTQLESRSPIDRMDCSFQSSPESAQVLTAEMHPSQALSEQGSEDIEMSDFNTPYGQAQATLSDEGKISTLEPLGGSDLSGLNDELSPPTSPTGLSDCSSLAPSDSWSVAAVADVRQRIDAYNRKYGRDC